MKSNCHVYLDDHTFQLKKIAVMCHQSQDPPVVTNNDTRTFLQRVIDSNKSDRFPGEYMEKLLHLNYNKFTSKNFMETDV